MNTVEKAELLKNVDLFSRLGPVELETVASFSDFYHYGKGDVIFEAGSVHDELYVIGSGEVAVTKTIEGGKTVDVARYVAGECFGEMGILDGKPRTATARAAEYTTLIIFPQRDTSFRELLEQHPAIFAQILHKLLAIVAGRIRSTNALISEKSPFVETLRRQLLYDELTGLYNRTFLEEDFVRLLPDYGTETAVLMVKPDNFKAINDTYGHEAGDEVLKLLAHTVASQLTSREVAVRRRGNEMVVILPGCSEEGGRQRAESLLDAIASLDLAPLLKGDSLDVTASAGIATYPRDATVAGELIEQAFAAMWKSRESGGNQISSARAVTT